VDVAGERLTAGMLSKIERGRVNPSLATLRYLAGRLGVPLAAFFAPAAPPRKGTGRALGDARAALWLGDPVGAERRARLLAGEGDPGGQRPPERIRAAALGLIAEAMLERGSAEGAAGQLARASEAVTGSAARGTPGALEAHLAWVLGLLERRRGRTAQAERAWSHCLDALEGQDGPGATLLRARVLLELGGLHGAAGGQETARQLVGRAVQALRWLVDPAAVARARLGAAGPAGSEEGVAEEDEETEEAETVAGVLAAVAVARRLVEEGQRELDRLDRPALRRAAGSPPEVPHSRHLR
jgi:transcriptional regulator with XRE-family HTH domain